MMLKFAQELIRIPSTSQNEAKVAEAIERKMLDLGYDEVRVDDLGNVIGRVGSGDRPRILFDGHMDTVGVTDASKWKHDPFGGEIEDGKLYGRGSSDMKGSIAAMVFAAAELLGDRKLLRGSVYVSCTVCEEQVEGPALGRAIEYVRPDYVVIGESSSLVLQIGQRGRGEVVVETRGIPAHSSTPHLGLNAVVKMTGAITDILAMPMPEDELLGPAVIELTDIISRPYPGISVVPDLCTVTFDRRLLVGETPESIVEAIEALLQKRKEADPKFDAQVRIAEAALNTYTGGKIKAPKFAQAWKTPKEHALVQKALSGLQKAGIPAVTGAYSFCTNGSYSAGNHGIPTIGFGPGDETQAHTIDEHISVDALVAGAHGYEQIMRAIVEA